MHQLTHSQSYSRLLIHTVVLSLVLLPHVINTMSYQPGNIRHATDQEHIVYYCEYICTIVSIYTIVSCSATYYYNHYYAAAATLSMPWRGNPLQLTTQQRAAAAAAGVPRLRFHGCYRCASQLVDLRPGGGGGGWEWWLPPPGTAAAAAAVPAPERRWSCCCCCQWYHDHVRRH